MSRGVRVATGIFIRMLLVPFINFGEIASTNSIQENDMEVPVVKEDTPELTPSYEIAVETSESAWRTGCDANWLIDTSMFTEGASSLRSGSIDHNGDSWIETTIQGPAIVRFD